jgi:hypothetical protein
MKREGERKEREKGEKKNKNGYALKIAPELESLLMSLT